MINADSWERLGDALEGPFERDVLGGLLDAYKAMEPRIEEAYKRALTGAGAFPLRRLLALREELGQGLKEMKLPPSLQTKVTEALATGQAASDFWAASILQKVSEGENDFSAVLSPAMAKQNPDALIAAAQRQNILGAYSAGARGSTEALVRGQQAFAAGARGAQAFAYMNRLVEVDLRGRIMGAVEFHLAQGDSWQALSKTLKNSMALTRSRAQMVARTEMGAAMAEGTKLRYEREGIEYVQFISTRSSATCSYCAWRHGNVYERATVIIKLHPNCRCTVVPWKPEWEEKGLTDPQADAKQRKAILEELEKSGKKPNYGPAPFERSVGLEKPQKPFWEPPPWKGPNVNRNKPYKGLSIGNPERSTTGELFKVSPPITISATGNTSYVAGVPGINQAIVNGRALLSSSVSPAQGKALQTQAASFVTQLKAKEAAVLQVVKGDAAGKVKALAAQKSGMKVLEEMAPGLDKAYKAALETPLSAKQVKGFVDGVEIVGATAVETKAIRSNLDEFARLFNGAGLTKARKLRVDRIVLTKGDPTDFSVYSFDPAKKQVSMPTGFMKMSGNGKKALFHEMAHAIEASQPKMVLRQEAWIKSRSPYSGPALMDAGYGPNDLMDAYPDKFVNSYVGTVYESNNIPGKGMDKMGEVFDDYDRATRGVERKWKYTPQATESISVGVEYFVDPIARAELWARDPDHFNLILSLTREILE